MSILSVERAEASEGNNLEFVVHLDEASENEVLVDFTLVQGSADEASDYQRSSGGAIAYTGVLRIEAGQTRGVITASTLNDGLFDSDESFWLHLTDPINASFADNKLVLRALGVVLDDDGSGSDLGLFVSDAAIVEGHSGTRSAVFEINLSRPAANDVVLSYRTVNGSAVAGEDYTARSGSVRIEAGDKVARVAVAVRGDTTDEVAENFSLVVRPSSAIQNGTAESAGVATILDDDTGNSSVPVPSIERSEVAEGGTIRFFRAPVGSHRSRGSQLS